MLLQCDPAEALRVLFDTMWAGPRYLLMIGGACPPVAAIIARALPALSLVQVHRPSSSESSTARGQLLVSCPSDVTGVLHGSAPQPVQQEMVQEPIQHDAVGPNPEPGGGEAAAAVQVEESRGDQRRRSKAG